MKLRRVVLSGTLLAVGLCLAGAQGAPAGDKFRNAPGKYEEVADVDRVEVFQAFKLSDYATLVIPPVDVASTPLPKKDDNTYRPVRVLLACVTAALTTQLADMLEGRLAVVGDAQKGGEPSPSPEKTLILRMHIAEMNPGSRAARMFVGMGAGRANVEVRGELVDAQTEKVLLKFESGRAGIKADEYESTLIAALYQNGDDLGRMLMLF